MLRTVIIFNNFSNTFHLQTDALDALDASTKYHQLQRRDSWVIPFKIAKMDVCIRLFQQIQSHTYVYAYSVSMHAYKIILF